MIELKEDFEYFIDCLNRLMEDKLIIDVSKNHPYLNKILDTREFAENLIKSYGMDFVNIEDNKPEIICNKSIYLMDSNGICNQLSIYQQLSRCISDIVFSDHINEYERLVGEFAICNAMLVKDQYITYSELEVIAKDFNEIFEIEINNVIPIRADWLLDINTKTNSSISIDEPEKCLKTKTELFKKIGSTRIEVKSISSDKELIIITGKTSSSILTKKTKRK